MGVDVHTDTAAVLVSRWWRINPDTGRREQGCLLKHRDGRWEVQHPGREPVVCATETAAHSAIAAILRDAWVWQTVNPERRKVPARAS